LRIAKTLSKNGILVLWLGQETPANRIYRKQIVKMLTRCDAIVLPF
jgi:hypothetical protein